MDAPRPSPPPAHPETFASAEAFLAAFAHGAGGLFSYFDAAERVRFASRGFATWFGGEPRTVQGRALREVLGEESYGACEPWLRQALAGSAVQYEREFRHPDGSLRWISVNLSPHRDPSGRVIGVFTSALEVRELKRMHDRLDRALHELASHIENTPLGVVEWSADLRVKRWSNQAEAIFGWRGDEVLGKTSTEIGLVHAESLAHVRELTRQLLSGRQPRNRMLARNITRDGRGIWCEWYNSAFVDADGRLASILSLAEDVTDRVDAEEQLKQAAVRDALTGLPNRHSLASRLQHAIGRVNRDDERLALLFIDLDRFKKVNDTLGHAAGDEVLRQAAARIRACVRDVDTVARLGGDEFVVLLEADVNADMPALIGERIRAAFAMPFDYKGAEVRCGASVGVSLYPDHARDPETLLASADQAMYRVKHSA